MGNDEIIGLLDQVMSSGIPTNNSMGSKAKLRVAAQKFLADIGTQTNIQPEQPSSDSTIYLKNGREL